MNNRHGRVAASTFLHEQKREWFSHDHTPPKNDNVRAGDVDLAFDEQPLNPKRSTWDESVRRGGREFRDIQRMKTIDIFARIECAHDCRFINLFRRRRLHKNAVNGWIAIQLLHARK